CKTKLKLYSLSFDDKAAWPCEERIFYFWPVFGLTSGEPEMARSLKVFQRSRIGKKRSDSVGCGIGVDDRVDQRRPQVRPSLMRSRGTSKSHNELLLQ